AVEVVEVDPRVVDDAGRIDGQGGVPCRVIRSLGEEVQRSVVGPRLAVVRRVVPEVRVAVVRVVIVGSGHVGRAVGGDPGLVHGPAGRVAVGHVVGGAGRGARGVHPAGRV